MSWWARWGSVFAVCCMASAAGASTGVVPRQGQLIPDGIAAGVDGQGVRFTHASGETSLVRWDQIARVDGELGAPAQLYASLSDASWRGRTRLERGDMGGAEPMFDAAATALGEQAGPLSAMVASGQLRCRLARHAQASSVRAWLSVLKAGEAEFLFAFASTAGEQPQRVIDEEYRLAPQLPPMWVASSALQVLVRVEEGLDPASDVGRMAKLYALSARAALGDAVVLPEMPKDEGGGPRLAWDVVAATAGNGDQRALARENLLARIADPGDRPWVEAWARAALGRSMLLERDPDVQRRGVVQMLHVPARFGDDYPYLSGVVLGEVSRWLAAQGRGIEAKRVWDEAVAKYGHAVDLGTPPIVATTQATPGA